MKIGITGATGTLGCRLTAKLVNENKCVIALCRNRTSAQVKLESSVNFIEGDITQIDTLRPFIHDLDVCIHLAAQVDYADKNRYWDVNVNGTKNICNVIMECNPKCRLIHCSSIAVLRLDKMKSIYSMSKAKGEEIVRSMMTNGLAATIIYSGLIFGPGDERLIPQIRKGLESGKMPLISGGESWAPLIYIDDLCDLFIKAAESDYAIGKSFLGIQQTSAGMHDFIRIVAEKCGFPFPKFVIPRMPMLFLANISEFIFLNFLFKKNPPISKRMIDILTLKYRPKSLIHEMKIGWEPKMGMEQGINNALQFNLSDSCTR